MCDTQEDITAPHKRYCGTAYVRVMTMVMGVAPHKGYHDAVSEGIEKIETAPHRGYPVATCVGIEKRETAPHGG